MLSSSSNLPEMPPQVAELIPPPQKDVLKVPLMYDEIMTRVYLADSRTEERSALRLMLLDLKMDVVGESSDWLTTLAKAPSTRMEMLLVDFDLLPTSSSPALAELRVACPNAIVIILISHLDARQQAALSAGADAFISKAETPERVSERLQAAALNIRNTTHNQATPSP